MIPTQNENHEDEQDDTKEADAEVNMMEEFNAEFNKETNYQKIGYEYVTDAGDETENEFMNPNKIQKEVDSVLNKIKVHDDEHPIPERPWINSDAVKTKVKPHIKKRGRPLSYSWKVEDEKEPKKSKISALKQKKITPKRKLQNQYDVSASIPKNTLQKEDDDGSASLPKNTLQKEVDSSPNSHKNLDDEISDLIETVRGKRAIWDFSSKIVKRSPAIIEKLWVDVAKECIGE